MKHIAGYIFSLLSILLLLSCRDKKNDQPPTMSMEAFVELLTDVRLLEGAYGADFQRIDSTNGLLDKYYGQVFSKHNVTEGDFLKNYKAFSQNAGELSGIEEQVMERLSLMQAEIQGHSSQADSLILKFH